MSGRDILVIDDDKELCALLRDYLGREGYQLEAVHDGTEGLQRALAGSHDLVLLDVMLPGSDGFDVLRGLRRHPQRSTVPVIMLTARGDDVDRIVGLELGADDYLPKPFNPRELSARIKAVLRRSEVVSGALPETRGAGTPAEASDARHGAAAADGGAQDEVLTVGPLALHLGGYRALLDGLELPLTTIEFSLLRELARAPGRALSRETLLDRVRGRELDLYDRSIDVHVSHLRHKLGDNPAQPRFIKTVRQVGYMFIGGLD